MTVRDLLSDETKWCKKFEARDKHNRERTITSHDAVKFCLVGAIFRCYDGDDRLCDKACKRVRQVTGCDDIAQWNDAPERTFADIRRVIEEAEI